MEVDFVVESERRLKVEVGQQMRVGFEALSKKEPTDYCCPPSRHCTALPSHSLFLHMFISTISLSILPNQPTINSIICIQDDIKKKASLFSTPRMTTSDPSRKYTKWPWQKMNK